MTIRRIFTFGCANLLTTNGVVYRVVEHEPEGRTEFIAQIRGNKPEQAIKSIVVQVRFGKKESRYYLGQRARSLPRGFIRHSIHLQRHRRLSLPALKGRSVDRLCDRRDPAILFNDQLILLADPLIQQNEEVVFNAGRLDRSIFMKSADYFLIAPPQLANIALRGSIALLQIMSL